MQVRKSTKNLEKVIQKAIKEIKAKKLAVGWSEKARYPNGDSVAEVAAVQEFGNPSKRIPPRPFMRPAIANNKIKWKTTMQKFYKNVVTGKTNLSTAFESVGLMVAGDIRVAITEVQTPKLAPSTIKARLRGRKHGGMIDKPLIDTGVMLNSITSEVQSE